ncbi:tetratricopeptide repeat protein [Candidatus Bathycorpusculum sp.]|jgi:tetratricopeptide (TPR) repeat protein|uniref:tetratricopeptide repeat protein n=1 Tax=Candidatus Bathycorpusculum sp. TaxID=2994959 RepID=UPI00281FF744|nr:tetratricopeptide repeat protein [Candidatus Termitimicrobium sp.]MCL2686272.1 tetratricopeptide repeat protein [Candidatus Termitimicrobium sp.]
MTEKADPIKIHKDANALMDSGKYSEARDFFIKSAELYYKNQNYFGSAEMNYKAGECSTQLKEYQKAIELFTKSADISLSKGFERYGISALENVKENQKALGNTQEVEELTKKIDELNKKQQEPESDSDFSIFS